MISVGSIGPIFTIFLPHGRYSIVDYRFDPPFSDLLRDFAMANNFRVKVGEIGRLICIHRLGIPKRIGIS